MIEQILSLGEKIFSVRWGQGICNVPQIAGTLILLWVLFWLIFVLVLLAYRIFLTVLVTRDANKIGENAPTWSTLTFFFGSLAVIPYLLVRKDVTEVKKDV